MVRDSFKKTYHWVLCLSPHTNSPLPSSITFSTTNFPQDSPNATMILCIKPEEPNSNKNKKMKEKEKATTSASRAISSPFQFFGRSKSMVLRESPDSSSKHVVIVMDALKEFSIEPLQWALDHVISTGYIITLLGVMPWLNLPLSSKTWLDVWRFDLDDLPTLRQRSEWIMDVKYQKVREIMELCDKYGVVPRMKVLMGWPSHLLVVEQTQYLHATWVVFDRYHRKNRAYYSKKIHCNVVMMNGEGEMDIIKTRTQMNDSCGETPSTPSQSPALPPIVSVQLSEKLKGILRPIKEQSNEDETTEIPQNTETYQIAETSQTASLRKANSQARKVQWLVI